MSGQDARAATVAYEHVSKVYEGASGGGATAGPAAVDDLSLTVPAGSVCVLVGPSGCGKTTSLKMVNRLVEPTSGRILLDGVDVATRDPMELRRGIGYVIQQVGLFPHRTVAENIATVPRLLGWPEARRRERADELLELVRLDPARYRDRYPARLSGGERQRVGVARALAADPPILLMDEPFAAVDPIVREGLQDELLRLQETLAKTILFVTHDIDEAIKVGDVVAVMEAGGRLAQFAPPAELLAEPASDFVARFVGADRGLKRLSLVRVGELALRGAVTARPGDDAAAAGRRAAGSPFPHLLLVDEANRPIGWVDAATTATAHPLRADEARASSPLLDRRTTAKEALAMLLEAGVQAGIVVDAGGAVVGLATLDAIVDLLREQEGAAGERAARERAARERAARERAARERAAGDRAARS